MFKTSLLIALVFVASGAYAAEKTAPSRRVIPIFKGEESDPSLAGRAKCGDVAAIRRLLEQGTQVDERDKGWKTALMWAVERGRLDAVRLLIDEGADVNATTRVGWTALMGAITHDDATMLELLISKGANVNVKLADGWTPLMFAADLRAVECVKLLLQNGADLSVKDAEGHNALDRARLHTRFPIETEAQEKAVAQVEALLKQAGAKRSPLSREEREAERHPLIAAVKRGNVAKVKLLLKNGAGVDDRDGEGKTALIWASTYRNESILRLLLEQGADPNRSVDALTALVQATGNRHLVAMKLLLDHGARIDETSLRVASRCAEHGDSAPLELLEEYRARAGSMPPLSSPKQAETEDARAKTTPSLGATKERNDTFLADLAKVGDVEGVKSLLEQGVPVDERDREGKTALMWAAERGHLELVKLLIQRGANPTRSVDGWTVFMSVCLAHNFEILQTILNGGGDPGGGVNSRDRSGRTPLMLASMMGDPESVAFLLDRRVDPAAVDLSGKTALDYAKARGHVEVVGLLQSVSVNPSRSSLLEGLRAERRRVLENCGRSQASNGVERLSRAVLDEFFGTEQACFKNDELGGIIYCSQPKYLGGGVLSTPHKGVGFAVFTTPMEALHAAEARQRDIAGVIKPGPTSMDGVQNWSFGQNPAFLSIVRSNIVVEAWNLDVEYVKEEPVLWRVVRRCLDTLLAPDATGSTR